MFKINFDLCGGLTMDEWIDHYLQGKNHLLLNLKDYL